MSKVHGGASGSAPEKINPIHNKNMLLTKTQSGPIKGAQKVVIYGPEGIGKSTLASRFPKPYFLDCEGGTQQMAVDRFNVTNIDEVKGLCAEIQTSNYETLVIDTADWCEAMMITAMIRRDKKASIEDYGYGKGYIEAQTELARLLAAFSSVIRSGIHVVVLAHSTIQKFEMPEDGGSYDRHQLKLTKKCSPLLKEWADMLLFINWDVKIATDSKTDKRRAVGGRGRNLHTMHTATYDAKNRHDLPDKIAIKEGATELPDALAEAIAIQAPTLEQPIATSGAADDVINRFEALLATLDEEFVNRFLASRDQINEGGTWRDAPPNYLERAMVNPDKFELALAEYACLTGEERA